MAAAIFAGMPMLYRLTACIITSLFISACADGAGDHANPLMVFAGQIAQGSVGSNSEALSSKTPPKNRQGKIAANSPQTDENPPQDVPLATDFGTDPTPVSAPTYTPPEPVAPPVPSSLNPAPVNSPW